MSSYLIITEVSDGKMSLKFVQSDYRISLNFAPPHQWNVGDTVAIELNRAPYPVAFDEERRVLFSLPKELPGGWEKGFYRLRNPRTNDLFSLDFDGIKGWESFAREAKRRNLAYPSGGKARKLLRGSREL